MILRAFFTVLAGAAALAASTVQAQSSAPPLPYEIARAQKDFPVTIYTSPNCKELCEKLRAALNQRSVPFTEEQVWNVETQENLKKVSGSNQVPVVVVGRTVLTGFDPAQIDDLLSSSGYPAAGTYPPRNQPAPPPPDTADAGKAAKPEPGPKPGPYDTSGLQGPAPKPGPYDPSGLQGPAPKPGPYGVPGSK